jgi:hypothetical protein
VSSRVLISDAAHLPPLRHNLYRLRRAAQSRCNSLPNWRTSEGAERDLFHLHHHTSQQLTTTTLPALSNYIVESVSGRNKKSYADCTHSRSRNSQGKCSSAQQCRCALEVSIRVLNNVVAHSRQADECSTVMLCTPSRAKCLSGNNVSAH